MNGMISRRFTFYAQVFLLSILTVGMTGCGDTEKPPSLDNDRIGYTTNLLRKERIGATAPVPPTDVLELVRYPSSVGDLAAYVSPDPKDGKRHPIMIWRVGGFANSIGVGEWDNAPADNDQTASQYRKAGVLMMYPSLRGGNNNPGYIEGCFGEVEDVLAAAAYAKKLPYIDASQIYFGGHSVGGTLALLVAAMKNNPFKAVIAFGAVESTAAYGQENLPFDLDDRFEMLIRSPWVYLDSIKIDTWVIEGTDGNIKSLRSMRQKCTNPKVRFYEVSGDHFSILAALNAVIAKQILSTDSDPSHNFALSQKLLDDALKGMGN